MTRKSSTLVLALLALGTTALSSTDAFARGYPGHGVIPGWHPQGGSHPTRISQPVLWVPRVPPHGFGRRH
jgi:hypothetical protein